MAVRSSLIALICVACACSNPIEARLPVGAVQFDPSAPYGLWWTVTESCSGITGDFDQIRWYVVPGTSRIDVNGHLYSGFWLSRSNRIVLAAKAVSRGALVRHEMLHALTQRRGHLLKDFVENCGGVVSCIDECAAETGTIPDPPAGADKLGASDLETSVRITPSEPSLQTSSGWIALTVSVKNPRPYAIWAGLIPVAAGASASATFGYVLECVPGCSRRSEYEFTSETQIGFRAGEARRLVFDRQLTVGDYSLRGFFNSDTSRAVTFSVGP